MKIRPITKEKLSTLRKSLPHGSVRLISEKTGYVFSYVSNVLGGKFYNEKIIMEALKLAEKTQSAQNTVNERIDKILGNGK